MAVTLDSLEDDINQGWLILCGALVLFMQAGFGMLEAGAVARKNVVNILFKNLLDASIAAVMFWLVGYGFAYGDTINGVLGTTQWAARNTFNNSYEVSGRDGWSFWFFQWTFAGAAATIVAGSVAERCKLSAYFIYSIFISAWIYPVVVHWVWGQGWLSAWYPRPYTDSSGNTAYRPIFKMNQGESTGCIDFAGSGVVHAVGGWAGLMGSLVLGPRKGRFDPITGAVNEMPAHNAALMSLGAFCLWFGWYGFNCGSTLALSGMGAIAGKVAMNTTISAGAAAWVGCMAVRLVAGHYDLGLTLNCLLSGLVGVTASCAVINPWMAVIIGSSSPLWYLCAHYLWLWLRIDDPLDAAPLHGVVGVWGLLVVGIFCTNDNVVYAGYHAGFNNNACERGEQFAVQITAAACIVTWTVVNAGLLFLVIRFTIGLRVSEEVEMIGMDLSEHGGDAYPEQVVTKEAPSPMPGSPPPQVTNQLVYAQQPQPASDPPVYTPAGMVYYPPGGSIQQFGASYPPPDGGSPIPFMPPRQIVTTVPPPVMPPPMAPVQMQPFPMQPEMGGYYPQAQAPSTYGSFSQVGYQGFA